MLRKVILTFKPMDEVFIHLNVIIQMRTVEQSMGVPLDGHGVNPVGTFPQSTACYKSKFWLRTEQLDHVVHWYSTCINVQGCVLNGVA